MKKTLLKIFTLMLTVLICLSCVACHDFGAGGNGGETGGGTTPTGIVAPADLPNSVIASNGVTFNYNTTLRQSAPMDILDATELVKRSCVALAVETADAEYTGSGVIVDVNDGESHENVFYIVTCHHLMIDVSTITVLLPNENFVYGDAKYTFTDKIGGTKTSNANNKVSLVGGDKASDIAVLKLDITGSQLTKTDIVKAKIIPDGYSVEYGEEVFAIGNPSGILPGTLSCGNISYLYRDTFVNDIGKMTLFQIDLTSHPGSSGGALFSMYGDLIGITNSGDEEYTGLNFAIPYSIPNSTEIDNGFINIVKQLIGTALAVDFENYGYISGRKETIGFVVVASELQGAKIEMVYENSIAKSKGMQVGDVITGLTIYENSNRNQGSNHNITSVSDFTEKMSNVKIGDTVVFSISRPSSSGSGEYVQTYKAEIAINQFYFANTGVYPS
ncbi:MAG: trypsin-like peptidase domain-containing protein [Clostridia bacterium]|nr:trypsin-like peptidase domain-containing protein [Clostridia bacterium]